MADYAHEETEKKLAELSSIIREVYNDAANDMQKTVDDYFASYEKRAEYQHSLVDKGEITESQYRQWEVNQMGRGERYKDMQSKLAERYTNANEVAIAYVNDMTPSVYTLNANYAAYEIETAGTGADFTLWDEATVRRQIVDHPDNMPYYPEAKAVARGFDIAYGKSQITSTITSAILQGKSIPAIANDLQDRLKKMNRTSAMRAARTAMTEAQNAGRLATYEAAEAMGIHVKKRWIASHDERTREWHAMADGQTVDYKEPFHVGPDTMMYPADPSGRPENVYNCRCTIVAEIASIDKIEPPIDESYEVWIAGKKSDTIGEPKEYKKLLGDYNVDDKAGKKEARKAWKGLESKNITKEEHDLIYEGYVGSPDSYKINSAMRNNPNSDLNDILREDYAETAQALRNVIAKNEMPEDTQVVRFANSKALEDTLGIDSWTVDLFCLGDEKERAAAEDAISGLIGQKIQENQFASASIDDRLNMFRGRQIKYEIDVDKGTPAYITNNFEESEAIFDSPHYEITGFDREDTGYGSYWFVVKEKLIYDQ